MKDLQITPSRIVMAACVTFLVGVAMASFGYRIPMWFSVALVGFGAFALLAFWPHRAAFGSKRYALVGFSIALIALGLGVARTEGVLARIDQIAQVLPFEERNEFTGKIIDHPRTDLSRTRFTFEIDDSMQGRVRISTRRNTKLLRGDRVRVEGRLRRPEPFDGFNYPMFLAKGGVVATMFTDDIVWLSKGTGAALSRTRQLIDETATSVLPYTQGALLKALLTGDEGSMTDDFKEALNRSGLRHLVAVSGMNIAIILGLLSLVATRLGRSKKFSFWSGLILVTFFILLIGAPASAVRAGIMGMILVAAPLLGRRGSGMRAATAAATIMVLISPLTLVYDVGFQLSFLAVVGIIVFGKHFQKWFSRLPAIVAETLAMTFAAQIAVAPILLASFQQISLVAPLSNLLVVPAIAPVTVWGFVAVLFGMVWLPMGQIVAAPLMPFFSFVGFVAERLGALPIAVLTASFGAGMLFSVVWYVGFVYMALRLHEKKSRPIDAVAIWEVGA